MKEAGPARDVEKAVLAHGRLIFAKMRGGAPRIFSRKNVTGRLLDWSMSQETLKVQLFRLVDVLPTLENAGEVARHARDYLDGEGLPWLLRMGLKIGVRMPPVLALGARMGVRQMAANFILAPDTARAIPKLARIRERGMTFTADILGETVLSEREAALYQQRYLRMIDELAEAARMWTDVEQVDGGGSIPKVNVSVKISALSSQIHPAAPEDAIERLGARLRPILRLAKERGVFINLDMEHYSMKDLTLALFKRMLEEPEFHDAKHVGIAMQAYLRETMRDMRELIAWAAERNRRVTVRLVKGAYWDTETLMAKQKEWPVPVYSLKHETDANYEEVAAMMLAHPEAIDCAFGTHNVRSMAACIAHAEALGRGPGDYEIQMLYGMAEPIKEAMVQMGHRVREYCPVGDILPGMSYLVRRLLENTSNEGFLRATFGKETPVEELLRDPRTITRKKEMAWPEPAFKNEAHTDFTKREARQKMLLALESEREKLGAFYPLLIGGKEIRTGLEAKSINPARPEQVIGVLAQAGEEQVEAAIAAAKGALETWGKTNVDVRAKVLERAAALITEARGELSALEVYEVGKSWAEADADVAEAIDFCRFYAGEMRRIDSTAYPVAGEMNTHHYGPRGVAVVIAPWNFPLAILCGMTAASLVCGNPVIMKPAEQSGVIGARLARLFHKAGAPVDALQLLSGGGSVGARLVEHKEVALVAFTGSRGVGLKIWEAAGRTTPGQRQLKKVICEMGERTRSSWMRMLTWTKRCRPSSRPHLDTRGRSVQPPRD